MITYPPKSLKLIREEARARTHGPEMYREFPFEIWRVSGWSVEDGSATGTCCLAERFKTLAEAMVDVKFWEVIAKNYGERAVIVNVDGRALYLSAV